MNQGRYRGPSASRGSTWPRYHARNCRMIASRTSIPARERRGKGENVNEADSSWRRRRRRRDFGLAVCRARRTEDGVKGQAQGVVRPPGVPPAERADGPLRGVDDAETESEGRGREEADRNL